MKKKMMTMLVLWVFVITFSLSAFGASQTEESAKPEGKVTILYTNDIHTYIKNQVKGEDGTMKDTISYGSVADLQQHLEAQGESVILVDAGDHIQGTAFGAADEGKSIINLMNLTGYQLSTLGNHEFDYGQFRAFAVIEEASFPYISCNFSDIKTEEPILDSYQVFEENGVRIAFIGISTPDTLTSGSPAYFQDEDGNFLYTFLGGDDGTKLYERVQATIDEVKEKEHPDYIIGLGHLGVDESSRPYTSKEVIAHTTGFDAFIDGHSHTTMEGEKVADAEGKEVLLTQTGYYFARIGIMTLENGSITTQLISEYDRVDEAVQEALSVWTGEVEETLGETIAVSDLNLYVTDAQDSSIRLIRRQETNLGDLTADSVYYYFNVKEQIPCDVAVVNGGGVRADLPAGELSYLSSKTVQPFCNVICLLEVKGQQILDMLEWGNRYVGVYGENGAPAEFGGFLHVAGLTFTVDPSIPCTIQMDENEIWTGSPTGEYRVQNVQIFNRETQAYEPLDLEKDYDLGGINYILRNYGNGYAMFNKTDLVVDYVGEDYMVAAYYWKNFAAGEDGLARISSANSPLNVYEGYKIDYENPLGSGRITILEKE